MLLWYEDKNKAYLLLVVPLLSAEMGKEQSKKKTALGAAAAAVV